MKTKSLSVTLLHNALIVTKDSDNGVFYNGAIVVEKDRIIALGQSKQIFNQLASLALNIFDLHGQILLPGFINTHVHTYRQLGRGIADDVDLMTWLHERIWPYESNMTEEDSYISTLLCGIEIIHSGVTCFAEAGGQHISEMARTVKLLRLRACPVQLTMVSGEVLPPSWANHTTDDCIQSQKELYKKHHDTADGCIRIFLVIRQIMNASEHLLFETRDVAKELKTGIYMADMIVIDPFSWFMTPIHNCISSLVCSMRSENIVSVMCNGQWIMKDRKILNVNEEEVISKARNASSELLRRAGITIPKRKKIL